MSREEATVRWRINLGSYVRRLREEKGLTQNELATAAALENKQSISAIETGRAGIPNERLAVFADALGVDRAEFVKQVLRWSDPWAYACLWGMDAQLRQEISLTPERVNKRHGPRHSSAADYQFSLPDCG